MDETGAPTEKRMRLRYAGSCRVCGTDIPARTEAVYERTGRTVRCLAHDDPTVGKAPHVADEPEPGTAGASARREFERRRTAREQRIRSDHPRLGGLILALSEEPQSTTAWDTGAVGEERLGRRLDAAASDTVRLLHDRRVPGSRANIDHLAVTSTGVHVIDAKRYTGRPQLKVEGGLLRPRVERLLVGRRDCTSLVDGVLAQVEVVRNLVGADVAVHGVLCFVDADWPLIGGAFATRGVDVLWSRRLVSALRAPGPLDAAGIAQVHHVLAAGLRPA